MWPDGDFYSKIIKQPGLLLGREEYLDFELYHWKIHADFWNFGKKDINSSAYPRGLNLGLFESKENGTGQTTILGSKLKRVWVG